LSEGVKDFNLTADICKEFVCNMEYVEGSGLGDGDWADKLQNSFLLQVFSFCYRRFT